MSAFVIAYSVVWGALAAYVVRLAMTQRQLAQVVDDLRRERVYSEARLTEHRRRS
ncbi:MAG: CcmD family protein [Planctomycetales bacterium]|nr:CcmD family protein [Planctomycetales bacterium]